LTQQFRFRNQRQIKTKVPPNFESNIRGNSLGNHPGLSALVWNAIAMGRVAMKRILKPISYVLAAIYLCVDFIFAGIAKPISNWLARRFEMRRLRGWIRSLSPYPSLALFSVPVILLEPVKFLAAYVAATGNFIVAAITFAVGELLKLVLIERLFDLTREKLMKISAFAWTYEHYLQAREWVMQSEAWRAIRSLSRSALERIKSWRTLGRQATNSSRPTLHSR
jgi:hypothetical protein